MRPKNVILKIINIQKSYLVYIGSIQSTTPTKKINMTTYFENETVEFHFFYVLNTHFKFCVNQMLFTIWFINLFVMHNFRIHKLLIFWKFWGFFFMKGFKVCNIYCTSMFLYIISIIFLIIKKKLVLFFNGRSIDISGWDPEVQVTESSTNCACFVRPCVLSHHQIAVVRPQLSCLSHCWKLSTPSYYIKLSSLWPIFPVPFCNDTTHVWLFFKSKPHTFTNRVINDLSSFYGIDSS